MKRKNTTTTSTPTSNKKANTSLTPSPSDEWDGFVSKFIFFNGDSNVTWTSSSEEAIKNRVDIFNTWKDSRKVRLSHFNEDLNKLISKYCTQEEKKKVIAFKSGEKTPSWDSSKQF